MIQSDKILVYVVASLLILVVGVYVILGFQMVEREAEKARTYKDCKTWMMVERGSTELVARAYCQKELRM